VRSAHVAARFLVVLSLSCAESASTGDAAVDASNDAGPLGESCRAWSETSASCTHCETVVFISTHAASTEGSYEFSNSCIPPGFEVCAADVRPAIRAVCDEFCDHHPDVTTTYCFGR